MEKKSSFTGVRALMYVYQEFSLLFFVWLLVHVVHAVLNPYTFYVPGQPSWLFLTGGLSGRVPGAESFWSAPGRPRMLPSWHCCPRATAYPRLLPYAK